VAVAAAKLEQAKQTLATAMVEKQIAESKRKKWFTYMEEHIGSLKMQELYDSVSFCYRILTDADSTNFRYLDDAGLFEEFEYKGSKKANPYLALFYFKRALSHAVYESQKIIAMERLADLYNKMENYAMTIKYNEQLLEICLLDRDKRNGLTYEDGIVSHTQSIGSASSYFRNYSNWFMAHYCYEIGESYYKLGYYAKAVEYFQKRITSIEL